MDLLAALADAPKQIKQRETAVEAADRLGLSQTEVEALRRSLGCHFERIESYTETEDGPVVVESGVEVIFRPASRPDANGHAGWLFTRRPDGRDGDPEAPPYATPVFSKVETVEPAKPRRAKKD